VSQKARSVWRNWSGSVECEPRVVTPSSAEEIAETVDDADGAFPREVRFNETDVGRARRPCSRGFPRNRGCRRGVQRGVSRGGSLRRRGRIPLSPANGRDAVFIAVHRYHKKPYRETFKACQEVFRDYDGRPHWGKMHFLSADELRGMYPEWDAFLDVRENLDPDGVFLNDHLRGVFGL